MGDPFSVTGSAIGVVSLGLTLCSNIISYCQVWKGQDNEISHLAQRVEESRITLLLLEQRLPNFRLLDPTVTNQIQISLLSCRDSIADINPIIAGFTRAQDDENLIGKLQKHKKKLLFPFKKDGLQNLSDTLSQFQTNLHAVVQLLQLETLSRQSNAITKLHALSAHTANEVQSVSERVEALNKSFTQLIAKLDSLAVFDLRDPFSGRVDTASCSASRTKLHFSTIQRRGDESVSLCACPPSVMSFIFHRIFPAFSLLYIDKNGHVHNDRCLMWKSRSRARTAIITISFFGRIYSGSFNLMTSHLSGEHRMTINPSLTVKATIKSDALAFRLIDEALCRLMNTSTVITEDFMNAYFV
ncbi:hypothetical protein AOQ84DRAFT_378075 [Glonium stellatum]|uniref:Fungal N-terminal domain-containing protein n=1 Tax=Glonium stellatum TaxID=574774 RepID=A0A8E2JRP1_9PEZI|nr:hypothetical protein AOQ84DRAFT_378075 [Glonium stellatum]